jgi:hypothetical protein
MSDAKQRLRNWVPTGATLIVLYVLAFGPAMAIARLLSFNTELTVAVAYLPLWCLTDLRGPVGNTLLAYVELCQRIIHP